MFFFSDTLKSELMIYSIISISFIKTKVQGHIAMSRQEVSEQTDRVTAGSLRVAALHPQTQPLPCSTPSLQVRPKARHLFPTECRMP